eukprot:1277849-Rhodomonas_salina.1
MHVYEGGREGAWQEEGDEGEAGDLTAQRRRGGQVCGRSPHSLPTAPSPPRSHHRSFLLCCCCVTTTGTSASSRARARRAPSARRAGRLQGCGTEKWCAQDLKDETPEGGKRRRVRAGVRTSGTLPVLVLS